MKTKIISTVVLHKSSSSTIFFRQTVKMKRLMKTKFFHSVIIVILFSMSGMAQQNKSMEVTVVAAEHFEESRQALLEKCSAENFIILSMTEIKDGSKPQSVDLELYTDDVGYAAIDLMLEKLGHVSLKKATWSQSGLSQDTAYIQRCIQQNNDLISNLTVKIAREPDLVVIYKKIDDLQKINKQLTFELNM